jgi:hypothetical protein
LPGKAYRKSVNDPLTIPADSLPLASSTGPAAPLSGLDPAKLEGLVIDDKQAKQSGKWTPGTGLKGYVGWNYLYAGAGSNASIRFEATAPDSGSFEIRLAYQPHENRGDHVPVIVETKAESKEIAVNMKQPPAEDGFISLGQFELQAGEKLSVTLSTKNSGGTVHADAVQIRKAPK